MTIVTRANETPPQVSPQLFWEELSLGRSFGVTVELRVPWGNVLTGSWRAGEMEDEPRVRDYSAGSYLELQGGLLIGSNLSKQVRAVRSCSALLLGFTTAAPVAVNPPARTR